MSARSSTKEKVRQPKALGLVRISGPAASAVVAKEEQEETLQRLAEAHGATIFLFIIELDVPGDLPVEERKGLQDAIDEVRKGEVSVVLATEPSRVARSALELLLFAELVERAGGVVYCDAEQVLGR